MPKLTHQIMCLGFHGMNRMRIRLGKGNWILLHAVTHMHNRVSTMRFEMDDKGVHEGLLHIHRIMETDGPTAAGSVFSPSLQLFKGHAMIVCKCVMNFLPATLWLQARVSCRLLYPHVMKFIIIVGIDLMAPQAQRTSIIAIDELTWQISM